MEKKKDTTIKIRVTTEMKALFKEVAPNGDMTKLIIACTNPIAEQRKVSIDNKGYLEERAINTDKKLQDIRVKMIERGNKKK